MGNGFTKKDCKGLAVALMFVVLDCVLWALVFSKVNAEYDKFIAESAEETEDADVTDDPARYSRPRKVAKPVNTATPAEEEAPHEAIDLGLPSGTMWATCNVGASSPEDCGDYFAWGETSAKETYTSKNSITYEMRYNDLRLKKIIDKKGNLTARHDAATVNWGGKWRMPTMADIEELLSECKWSKATVNGVDGYKISSTKNKNSIFLPKAGLCGEQPHLNAYKGYYWSSTVEENVTGRANYLYLINIYHFVGDERCYYGFPVRPVTK